MDVYDPVGGYSGNVPGLLRSFIFAYDAKPDIVDSLRGLVVHSKCRAGTAGAIQPGTASYRFSACWVVLIVSGC